MACDRVPREQGERLPYQVCGQVPQEQKERNGAQSAWSRGCGSACNFSQRHAVDVDVKRECLEPANGALPSGPPSLPLDGDPALHDLLVAALEVHQKRTEELHAQLLTAFSAIEERIAHALRDGLQGGFPGFPAAGESPGDFSHAARSRSFTLQMSTPKAAETPVASSDDVRIDLQSGDKGGTREQETLWSGARGRFVRMVNHPMFEVVVTMLIWMSVLVTFVEEQYEGYKADVSLGLDAPGNWPNADKWFEVLDNAFNIIFVVEMCMLLSVRGWAYLKDLWGCFDLGLMVLSIVDSWLLIFFGNQSGQNYKIVRIVRLVRLLRTMRVAGQLKILEPLHLFMRTIVASMYSLLWSLVLLAGVQLMGAMFVTKSLHHYIVDPANDLADRQWANRVFGSGTKSIYTFFEITFSGGWPNHVRPLMERINPWYAIFFMVYISGWAFALMRIISALFIKETFSQASKDEANQAKMKNDENRRLVRRLKMLFQKADTSQDGLVGLEEFMTLSQDEAVVNWFEVNDISMKDVRSMWELLDNSQQEEMNIDDFVEGLLRLRGPAKAQDMMAVMQGVNRLNGQCKTIALDLAGLENRIASLQPQRRPFASGPLPPTPTSSPA